MKLGMNLLKWDRKSSGRIKFFQCITIVVFLYLFGGLFFRQIVQNSHFQQKLRQQSIRRITFPAVRGKIYDRNGNILVENRPVFSLNLYLDELREDFHREFLRRIRECSKFVEKFDRIQIRREVYEFIVNETLSIINDILGRKIHVSGQDIDKHMSQCPMLPMTILHDISAEECDKLIDILPITSPLQINANLTRHYPNGALACHVLGYTVLTENQHPDKKYDDHVHIFFVREQIGKSGVEKCADHILAGEAGYENWTVDHTGNKNSLNKKVEPRDGQAVYLSIDKNLQKVTEEALSPYVGSAVVIDANSGEILALANSPSYDPNIFYPSISKEAFDQISERNGWLNQALQGLFPIGSISRTIAAVAFIKSGEIDANGEWLCTGIYECNGELFKCDNHPHGERVNLKSALCKNCNTYMFDKALKIGHRAIIREGKKFGLGSKTEVELPHETNGSVILDTTLQREYKLDHWAPKDTFNLVIGKGCLLTTSLNVCCFTASLAKNRYRTRPTIFKGGKKISDAYESCLSDKDHKFLVDAMVDCVENHSGHRAKINGLAVAGKTGTAKFKEHKKKRRLVWFTCFAPAYDPQIAVAVLIQEQKNTTTFLEGSQAAHVAKKILLKYFNPN
ncbi:MAG: hypothetical protein LBF94_01705 [Puniceicoccales bacterium]|jgi:penicillin-binding protein 2|nr:hypothetical protein [Puniceicoccales bacterium]